MLFAISKNNKRLIAKEFLILVGVGIAIGSIYLIALYYDSYYLEDKIISLRQEISSLPNIGMPSAKKIALESEVLELHTKASRGWELFFLACYLIPATIYILRPVIFAVKWSIQTLNEKGDK